MTEQKETYKNNMPSREEILKRAVEIAKAEQAQAGLPALTPSEEELKENGYFEEARLDLMRVDQKALADQQKYVSEAAEEAGLAVLTKQELKELLKRNRELAWKAKTRPRIERPTPSFMKSQESQLDEREAALIISLNRAKTVVEDAMIRAAMTKNGDMELHTFMRCVRDHNQITLLLWKMKQDKRR